MIRKATLAAVVAATLVSCAASGPTYYGFRLDVRSAPPPPRVVLVEEPRLVDAGSPNVYIVVNAGSDYDMFRYGSSWYVCYEGYWYRAGSYGGPYVAVDVRSVPSVVVSVPPEHWKHHPHGGPPGQMKKRRGWVS